MAKLSDLVTILALEHIDVPATLQLFSRRLREAGRVTKAKRGFGAAEATPLDAARLLISMGAADRPEQAVEGEMFFSSATADPMFHDAGIIPLFDEFQEQGARLDDALATILGNREFIWKNKPLLQFERATGSAKISVDHAALAFQQPEHLNVRKARLRGWDGIADPEQWECQQYASIGQFGSGKNICVSFDPRLLLSLSVTLALKKEQK